METGEIATEDRCGENLEPTYAGERQCWCQRNCYDDGGREREDVSSFLGRAKSSEMLSDSFERAAQ